MTTKRNRTQEIALMMASAVIPRTFQRSLLERGSVDQGIVTGLTVVMVYLLGLITQDAIESGADVVMPDEDDGESTNVSLIAVSAVAVGLGLLAEKLNPYDKDEKLTRSAMRTGGYWLRNTGIAGIIHSCISMTNETVSENNDAAKQRNLLPYFMAAGVLYSLAIEYANVRGTDSFSAVDSLVSSKPARAVGVGAGVAAALVGVAYAERTVAKNVDNTVGRVAPKLKNSWLPIGHLVGGGVLLGGLYALLHRTYGKIEHQAGLLEQGFEERPSSSLASGGPQSLVSWESLSVQGRRHVGTRLSSDDIVAVMHEEAQDPIRIYIGLDSAPTEQARVELALAELERTGAFTREVIVVVSPTGTGYVNYVMSEAAEYLTRGSVASVTLQYSKRPSPMSLDRVDEGHVQYRMFLNALRKKIAALPMATRRPRVVLFGESLGAWTSQDAFMHEGTDGLIALGIDRALWIGTPEGSKWKDRALSAATLNTEQELVGIFDNYNDVLQLRPSQRAQIRYTMLTHHNDPIAQFGLGLLIKQPEWVKDETKRPKGIRRSVRYRTPTLFVQTLVDMKNALKPEPGKFVASAHDYRGDLANFVGFAFGLSASKKQMVAIEQALRDNEVSRENRIKHGL